jgi:hypothetical protein
VVQVRTAAAVWIQLSQVDPPDFYLFQWNPTHKHLPWITYVEHTTYNRDTSSLNLAEQLS